MQSLRLPSPALVLAIIAVFAACTGGAFAAGKITGSQIKNGSITGKDIKNDSLTATDIKGQVRGPQGPKGDRGPAGAAGAGGGPPAITYVYSAELVPGDDGASVKASCPAGQVAIGGGYQMTEPTDRAPSRNGPAPTPSSPLPTDWDVVISSASPTQTATTVTSVAICTKPGSVSQVFQP